MRQLGGGFRCVFACSIGPNLSNEPGKYAGPGKYAMVLATFVLSTTIVLLIFPVPDQWIRFMNESITFRDKWTMHVSFNMSGIGHYFVTVRVNSMLNQLSVTW